MARKKSPEGEGLSEGGQETPDPKWQEIADLPVNVKETEVAKPEAAQEQFQRELGEKDRAFQEELDKYIIGKNKSEMGDNDLDRAYKLLKGRADQLRSDSSKAHELGMGSTNKRFSDLREEMQHDVEIMEDWGKEFLEELQGR